MEPMRAVTILEPGEPEVLSLQSAAMPEPAEDEILIEVRAAGVNRPDIAQRRGRYPVPPDASPIPGLEVAGVVAALGRGVRHFRTGQPVMALTHGGGYATFCRVEARHALPIPADLTFVEAAAVPEVAFTVEFNLVMRAALREGETVLVHGGSSGIGSHAIARAKSMGAKVIATAGSDEKCAFCVERGADHAINYKARDWKADVAHITAGQGVDIVLDMVAGDYTQKNIESLATDGRYALISLQGGRSATIDMDPILRRRLTLTGSTLRPLPSARKAEIAARVARDVVPLFASGRLARPYIFETFPLAQASQAHRLMESGRHVGKIVLVVP